MPRPILFECPFRLASDIFHTHPVNTADNVTHTDDVPNGAVVERAAYLLCHSE